MNDNRNNILHLNDIQIKEENKSISLKHKNGFNLIVKFCECDCDCHKNNSCSPKSKTPKIRDNIPINIKQNSFKSNSFSNNNSKHLKKEYSFDIYNNNTDINRKLKDNSSTGIIKRNNSNINYEKKTYDLLNRKSLNINKNNKNQNNGKDSEKNNLLYPNNDFVYYKNDLKNFNKFIQSLRGVKNEKKMVKCTSLKNFRHKNNNDLINENIINNNSQIQDDNFDKNDIDNNNINIVYDKNNFIKNSKILDNDYRKLKDDLKINNKIPQRKKENNVLSKNNNTGNKKINSNVNKNNYSYLSKGNYNSNYNTNYNYNYLNNYSYNIYENNDDLNNNYSHNIRKKYNSN